MSSCKHSEGVIPSLPWHYCWNNFKHSAVISWLATRRAEVSRYLQAKRNYNWVWWYGCASTLGYKLPLKGKGAHRTMTIKRNEAFHTHLISHSDNVNVVWWLKPFIFTSILQDSKCVNRINISVGYKPHTLLKIKLITQYIYAWNPLGRLRQLQTECDYTVKRNTNKHCAEANEQFIHTCGYERKIFLTMNQIFFSINQHE